MSKKNQYGSIDKQLKIKNIEQQVLDYWKKNDVFEKSVLIRKNTGKEFVFYDGPPFANGAPHYGHLLTGYLKDVFPRYKTMKNMKVERRFGWDCHGLPAEMYVEKKLNISGAIQIKEYGISKFNEACAQVVTKYTELWKEYINRQGRWVDLENTYKTMDITFMESILWAFKELYKKGYIYEAEKVMPYSWACQTPLSNFETRLDNCYRERADKSITVKFKLLDENFKNKFNINNVYFLVWTTTPWTLPSNLALAINKDLTYFIIKKASEYYIITKSLINKYENEIGNNIVGECLGKELLNISYEPMFTYYQKHKNAFKVLSGDFVTDDTGTGIVHVAPGFGEEDYNLCKVNNIQMVCPVDAAGKFTNAIFDFAKMNVFDAIDPIVKILKNTNKIIKLEQYLHNYPHCWRTDTPLIYKAIPSWYVKVTAFKDRMVELNQQVNWIPNHIKNGIFGSWLADARDWSISRNRFWGTPIPVWQSTDDKYPRIDVYGSIDEIEKDFDVKIKDLHLHNIINLTRINPDDPTGKSMMKHCGLIFDCWFESGSMPFAQQHYPFENQKIFKNTLPSDFIVEYVAQTRGWFYTLFVLSTALFDKPPFLNCICHGVISDINGKKLSKRLDNYPNPMTIFNKYGSDALRVTLLSSGVVKGDDFMIDKEGKIVYENYRMCIQPIWQAVYFYTSYANSDNIKGVISFKTTRILNRYILAHLRKTVLNIDNALNIYDTQSSYKYIINFFEILNNWYIRRSREIFWQHQITNIKQETYNTLFTILSIITKAIAPLLPFLSEYIHHALYHQGDFNISNVNNSIHLEYFPNDIVQDIPDDDNLNIQMQEIISICSATLQLRNQQHIRVRQPLLSLSIIGYSDQYNKELIDIIKDELNIKEVLFLKDTEKYATVDLTLNFSIIAKRIPNEIKNIIKAKADKNWVLQKDGSLILNTIHILKTEFNIKYLPKQQYQNNLTTVSGCDFLILLDNTITEELLLEGFAKDFIRSVQQNRKNKGFHFTDYINIKIASNDIKIKKSIDIYSDMITKQCLIKKIDIVEKNQIDRNNIINIVINENMISINLMIIK